MRRAERISILDLRSASGSAESIAGQARLPLDSLAPAEPGAEYTLTICNLLDAAEAELDERFADQPELAEVMRGRIRQARENLGQAPPPDSAPTGLVYLTGPVERPGPYALPREGKLTVARLLAVAGGLGVRPATITLQRTVNGEAETIFQVTVNDLAELAGDVPELQSDDLVIIAAAR